MMRIIPGLLTPAEVKELVVELERSEFVDGGPSAGRKARLVKKNQHLVQGSQRSRELSAVVLRAIDRNSDISKIALPNRVAPILFNRYEPGMEYGFHMDMAIQQSKAGPFRTDISMTLFLSAPGSYQGGELEIDTDLGEQQIKLAAGDALLYPSTSLHRVKPVLSGTRLAAVTWFQSLVGDPARRQILYEIQSVRDWLLQNRPNSAEDNTLAKVHGNLLRRWADL
jgi:PKHD-type hydroxylase